MKINRDELDRLTKLSDEQLWEEIVKMGESRGFKLPKSAPPHSELMKLRELVGGSKISVSDAYKILNAFRRSADK